MWKKLAEFGILCSVIKVVVCYLLNKRMATFTIVPYCQQIAEHSAHSATTSALVGRRTQRATIGDRAFAAAAPAVWNSLPEDVRSSTSLPVFRHRLKTELYRRSFGPRHFVSLTHVFFVT